LRGGHAIHRHTIFVLNRPASCLSFTAAAAMLLAGCAAPPPDPVPAPLDVPTAWTQAGPSGPAPADLRGWWKAFGDPALDALVDEALAHNVDLAIAGARLRESRLQGSRAAVAFRPSFAANAQTLQDISATDTYFHASIDMVWELGLFGAGTSTRQAASADADAAESDAQGVRVAVVADVVRSYLDLQAARRQLQLQQELAGLDARSIALAEVRQQARIGQEGELALARVRADQARAAQALPREAMARAAHALAVLLGRYAPDPAWSALPAGIGAVALHPGALAELPADLVRTRPDVRSAEAQVRKAAAEVGLARSELYPRIAIMGSLLYAYNLTKNFRTRTDNVPAFGPVIDIPLFDWGRRSLQVQAQQEALNAALLGYRRAVLAGVGEAEGALAAYAAQQARARALEQAWSGLRAQAAAGQVRQDLGLASTYDGLALRRAALQAQAELLTAQDAQALAYVALYKALGGAPLPAAGAAQATAAEGGAGR
jgi:NodT family efflux transporter outer membrane factor (OMF) lipoprotein